MKNAISIKANRPGISPDLSAGREYMSAKLTDTSVRIENMSAGIADRSAKFPDVSAAVKDMSGSVPDTSAISESSNFLTKINIHLKN